MRSRRREQPSYRHPPAYLNAINCAGLLGVLIALVFQFMLSYPSRPWDPKLPEAADATAQADPSRGTLLTLSADGSVFLNQQPISPSQVSELIRPSCAPAMGFSPYGSVLFIEADPELSYSSVVDVLDQCRSYGGFKVVFLTQVNVSIADSWALGPFSTN